MPPRTPLLRPDRFFVERELDVRRVLAVVGVATVVALAVFYGIGWIVATHVDGTVMIDNPERPPDWICEEDSDVLDRSGCEKPRRIERNVDSQIWKAWNDTAGRLVIGVPLAWLLVGVLLHVGSSLVGGQHGVFPSFAVAAWGLVPTLASGIVIMVALSVTFDPITVTPANQDTALEAAKAPFRTLESTRMALAVATAGWSAAIWRYGLEHERGISGPEAWLVAGIGAALVAAAGFA